MHTYSRLGCSFTMGSWRLRKSYIEAGAPARRIGGRTRRISTGTNRKTRIKYRSIMSRASLPMDLLTPQYRHVWIAERLYARIGRQISHAFGPWAANRNPKRVWNTNR